MAYDEQELFQRIGLGTRDVPAAVALLRRQGVDFVETDRVHVTPRGAITRNVLRRSVPLPGAMTLRPASPDAD